MTYHVNKNVMKYYHVDVELETKELSFNKIIFFVVCLKQNKGLYRL